eukprot:1407294-Rhodomonas_salina.1
MITILTEVDILSVSPALSGFLLITAIAACIALFAFNGRNSQAQPAVLLDPSSHLPDVPALSLEIKHKQGLLDDILRSQGSRSAPEDHGIVENEVNAVDNSREDDTGLGLTTGERAGLGVNEDGREHT